MNVFMVTSGSYSDYGVDGIFSSRELAEEYIRSFPDSECNGIQELTLDPGIEEARKGLYPFYIHMRRDGTVERCAKQDRTGSMARYNLKSGVHLWLRSQAPAYKGKDAPDVLSATIWAKTEKQAIKAANEKRTQIIAAGEWEESGGDSN